MLSGASTCCGVSRWWRRNTRYAPSIPPPHALRQLQVHFVNGTVRTMPRRERPQLYLDATLTPRVLYTGLVVSGTSVYNPAFTSAQGVIVD